LSAHVLAMLPLPSVQPLRPDSNPYWNSVCGVVPAEQSPACDCVVNENVADAAPLPHAFAAVTRQKNCVLDARSTFGVAVVPATVSVNTMFVNAASVATSIV